MKKTLLVSLFAVASTVLISGFIMNASAEEGNGFFGGLFGGGRDKMIENKAEALGLSAEELQTKLDEGLTFPEILEESGLSQEELHEKMQAQRTAEIDSLVSEGKISAEFGEEIKQNMAEREQNMAQNGFKGKGQGRGLHVMNGECDCQDNTATQ